MLEVVKELNGFGQNTQIADLHPETSVDGPVVRILFDESHDELLRSQPVPDDDEVDTWSELGGILQQEMKFEVFPEVAAQSPEPQKRAKSRKRAAQNVSQQETEGTVKSQVNATPQDSDEAVENNLEDEAADTEVDFLAELGKSDVLVLGAPRERLQTHEVEAITGFVQQGGSLLIAHSYESLWWQEKNGARSTVNRLLEAFGLNIKQLLNWTQNRIDTHHLRPHFLSSAVSRLVVKEPTYLERLNDIPYVAATLPETDAPFLAAVEVGRGRVVAIGDFAIFGDRFIHKDNNRELACNIFRWLARENPLDFLDAQFESEVRYGQTATFSIGLKNPHQERLEHISCSLESDASAMIDPALQTIRSLPGRSTTHLQWTIEPLRLGAQNLRLTVDFKPGDYEPIFLDSVAKFACVPDADIELVFPGQQLGEAFKPVETGVPVEVQARVRWANGAKPIPLSLDIKRPLAHVAVEPLEASPETHRWRLTALDAGDWQITLEVPELNQKLTRLLHATPSTQDEIKAIERDMVQPLEARIRHQITQIRLEFGDAAIQDIPFRVLIPEEQARILEPPSTKEHLLEVIQAARVEKTRNRPLVEELLLSIAPTYSSVHGCCTPYDPKLAWELVEYHAPYEENLAYNLLGIKNDPRYGQIWMEQNIAALILHEKYGHGFFFIHTTLGRQLAILERHGLAPDTDPDKDLKSPYLRKLHHEYREVIEVLHHSAITLNEGFATWVELTVLPRLGGVVGEAAYRRKDFLFNRNTSLERLAEYSAYFQQFHPWRSSKYQEGAELLELIAGYFGPDCGPKCAVQAVIKAGDVDCGITEASGQVQISLESHELYEALLDKEQNNDFRAGMRLRDIHAALRENSTYIREEQKRLQCHRTCLHSECPVNKIVEKKTGW